MSLYDILIEINDSPIVLLNRTIVFAKTSSPKKALLELKKIKDNSVFYSYFPYYTAKSTLLFQNKESKKATELLNEALKQFNTKSHKKLINNILEHFSENI